MSSVYCPECSSYMYPSDMVTNTIDSKGFLEEYYKCHNCGDGFTVVYAKSDWDYIYNRKPAHIAKARPIPGIRIDSRRFRL